ncbi:hypothetical protein HRbin20_01604 [bacterium HR20]|nr:hypothetical protein HRbin20_01604 [bacterium HR20]
MGKQRSAFFCTISEEAVARIRERKLAAEQCKQILPLNRKRDAPRSIAERQLCGVRFHRECIENYQLVARAVCTCSDDTERTVDRAFKRVTGGNPYGVRSTCRKRRTADIERALHDAPAAEWFDSRNRLRLRWYGDGPRGITCAWS